VDALANELRRSFRTGPAPVVGEPVDDAPQRLIGWLSAAFRQAAFDFLEQGEGGHPVSRAWAVARASEQSKTYGDEVLRGHLARETVQALSELPLANKEGRFWGGVVQYLWGNSSRAAPPVSGQPSLADDVSHSAAAASRAAARVVLNLFELAASHRLTRYRREHPFLFLKDIYTSKQFGRPSRHAREAWGRPVARQVWFHRRRSTMGPFGRIGDRPWGPPVRGGRGADVSALYETLLRAHAGQARLSPGRVRRIRVPGRDGAVASSTESLMLSWVSSTLAKALPNEWRLAEARYLERMAPDEALDRETEWKIVGTVLRNLRYSRYTIPKRTGGVRELDVPPVVLREMQGVLANLFVLAWPGSGPACAFAPGKNVVVHAAAHAGARAAVKLDIRDFFGSIDGEQALMALCQDRSSSKHFLHGWSVEGCRAIARACLVRRGGRLVLPQGAPTSPALSNIVARELDGLITARGNERFGVGRWTYTRYADDLVLSSRDPAADFVQAALEIIDGAVRTCGWEVRGDKTQTWLIESGMPLMVCGLRVGDHQNPVALARDASRDVRAAVWAGFRQAVRMRLPIGRAKSGSTQNDTDGSESYNRLRGLSSWAYAVTGDLRYLALGSRRVRLLGGARADSRAVGSVSDPAGPNGAGGDADDVRPLRSLVPRAPAESETGNEEGQSPVDPEVGFLVGWGDRLSPGDLRA
jgi:hypothetical protein